MRDLDDKIKSLANEAEGQCRYIFDALDVGDKLLGVRRTSNSTELVFREDDQDNGIGVQALLDLADLIRREKIL